MSLEAALAAAIRATAAGAALDFESWALRVFAHQLAHDPPYRDFCRRRGVTPATVARWQDVPAVPAAAFKRLELACGAPEATFRSSGTTQGPDARSRHLVPHLDLYRASALTGFARAVLPDGERPHALFLLPPPDVRPDSSLVRMCAFVGEALVDGHEWLADAGGLALDRLTERLAALSADGRAVLVAGPTAAFARLFATDRRFRLGPGSRIMDTGGAKGMDRPLSRAGFLRACWSHLGVAGYWCVNEYGMTELCSQYYDSALADRLAGRSLDARRLVAPPWLRTRVLDPDTLDEVPAGRPGILCHHDLANAGSVSVVLTEDLGHTVGDDGLAVTGRVPGAVPRGCGLLLAELAEGAAT
ncbi:MAG: long-chain fatty acid--CoA ligase [bacterium]|nr:long-chain fatty acid--CoA ligase [bacterium]